MFTWRTKLTGSTATTPSGRTKIFAATTTRTAIGRTEVTTTISTGVFTWRTKLTGSTATTPSGRTKIFAATTTRTAIRWAEITTLISTGVFTWRTKLTRSTAATPSRRTKIFAAITTRTAIGGTEVATTISTSMITWRTGLRPPAALFPFARWPPIARPATTTTFRTVKFRRFFGSLVGSLISFGSTHISRFIGRLGFRLFFSGRIGGRFCNSGSSCCSHSSAIPCRFLSGNSLRGQKHDCGDGRQARNRETHTIFLLENKSHAAKRPRNPG